MITVSITISLSLSCITSNIVVVVFTNGYAYKIGCVDICLQLFVSC